MFEILIAGTRDSSICNCIYSISESVGMIGMVVICTDKLLQVLGYFAVTTLQWS